MKKQESNFISLMSDYGFKATFADEKNTLFLRRALMALLGIKQQIKRVKFINNEEIGLTKDARGGLFDLICEDESGRTFIVEMQLGPYTHFIQRSKFYAFHRFNTMVAKGDYKFDDLMPIYCIGFLANNIFHHSEHYHHYGTLKNQHAEEMDSQTTHIIVEIRKFDKELHELNSDLDKLVFIMKNLERIKGMSELPKVLSEEWLEHAINKVDKNQMTLEERMIWEMTLARNASILYMEEEQRKEEERKRKKREAARRRKYEAQLKKEMEVEKAQMEEQVAKEKAAKAKLKAKLLKTAKALKDKGADMDFIVEITGLTKNQVQKL